MEENQPKRAEPNILILSRRRGHDHELPQPIVEEIIERLPAKSVVRFKSVCRQWLNIISELDLPEVKFQQSISKIKIFYQIRNDATSAAEKYSYCSFKLDEKGMKAKKVDTFCLQNVSTGSPKLLLCNSLLLFRGNPHGSKLYVYDTIKQQQKLLPGINGFKEGGGSCYSMVYDASKRKYKVVVFVPDEIRGMKLLLYDLNPRKWGSKGKWRKCKPPFPQLIVKHSSIVLQGVFYWIAEPYDEMNVLPAKCFIQPVEIATEKFMERVEAPCQLVRRPFRGLFKYESAKYELLEMKGSLCLAHAASVDELNVWVLKDSLQSIWNKQYNISLSSLVDMPILMDYDFSDPRCCFRPKLIVENHMLVTIGLALYSYNMDTKELSEITVETDPNCYPRTFSITKC